MVPRHRTRCPSLACVAALNVGRSSYSWHLELGALFQQYSTQQTVWKPPCNEKNLLSLAVGSKQLDYGLPVLYACFPPFLLFLGSGAAIFQRSGHKDPAKPMASGTSVVVGASEPTFRILMFASRSTIHYPQPRIYNLQYRIHHL